MWEELDLLHTSSTSTTLSHCEDIERDSGREEGRGGPLLLSPQGKQKTS